MARGSKIIVSAQPQGHFEDCIVSGTPKPGTHMELVPGTVESQGVFTYRARSLTDGARGPVCILLEDAEQGKLATDAYVSGTRGKVYWPVPGEEFNMLLRYQSGTGTVGEETVGDYLEIDGASGMLQADGAHASAPYQLLEHLGAPLTANSLVWVKFVGGSA